MSREKHDIVADAIDRKEEVNAIKRMILTFTWQDFENMYEFVLHPFVEIFYREHVDDRLSEAMELDDDEVKE